MNLRLIRLITMILVAAGAVALGSPIYAQTTCPALDFVRATVRDATPALQTCIRRTPAGTTLQLKPGLYRLRSALIIDRPLTIMSSLTRPNAAACSPGGDRRCAILYIDYPAFAPPAPGAMPITVAISEVTFSHLIIRGSSGESRDFDRKLCSATSDRGRAGGVRVTSSKFTMIGSVVQGVKCYTSVEVLASAKSPILQDNTFGPNGTHDIADHWADGVTIHDTTGAIIIGNRFSDNTDVQLIIGGCKSCRIERNVFRHSTANAHGSFAEIMLHGWPNTSGDYDGTLLQGNDIDCGAAHRCGFGIMIGPKPWYQASTSGGLVEGNHVRNAKVGLNVDSLTGPMTITGNSIKTSGGTYASSCGRTAWPSSNISPSSKSFIRGAQEFTGSSSTANCILP